MIPRMDGWQINRTRLRTLREDAGLSQTAMAELCGYHVRHYNRFEAPRPWASATVEPSMEMVSRILDALSEHLGRDITVADIADPAENLRRPVRRPRDAA